MPVPTIEPMYAHYLDIKKGWNANMNALDYQARISDAVTFVLDWGRVVHLNASGEFATGCHATGVSMFLWQGPKQTTVAIPNIANPTTSTTFIGKSVSPGGTSGALVATGAIEIGSTEYDKTKTYLPNQLLTSVNDDDDGDVGGLLTNEGSGAGDRVEQYVDPVCGVVSSGVEINWLGAKMLSFHPVWLPGAFA